MSDPSLLATVAELPRTPADITLNTRIVDCRFLLGEPRAGRSAYAAGHVPGAHFLDMNEDLAGPAGAHGGRHPPPAPAVFAARLAALGIGLDTPVIAYDDNRLAGAARFWWLAQSLGYRKVRVLDGGWQAWLAAGGSPCQAVPAAVPCAVPLLGEYRHLVDRDALLLHQADGALLIDAREPRRYAGLEEPIDPVAGHIPGAVNLPWQDVTDGSGHVLPAAAQQARWDAVEKDRGRAVVVYCGSGITACVNLFSLALAQREAAYLYGGSWSDWCSWLPIERGMPAA